ncbi:MAG: PAS domain-containing protein [Alphaproteobacteria bacterium]|nr:PAS domain-containing protein [Alphaproteobacteria bacterium]
MFFNKSRRKIEELETERARLQAFLDAFPGAWCGFLNNGAEIVYSRTFTKILGCEKVHSLGDIQSVLSMADAAALENAYVRLKESGRGFSISAKLPSDGRMLMFTGSQGKDDKEQLRFHTIWVSDITTHGTQLENVKNELEQVKYNFRRLQAATDALSVPVWLRRKDGSLDWCNKFYADGLKSTPADIIAGQAEYTLSPDKNKTENSVKTIRQMAEQALAKNETQTTERHVIVSGARKLWQISETALENFEGTIGSITDKSREEELLAEAKRGTTAYQELLEHLQAAVSIFDANQQLEFYNSNFAKLWGLEEQWLNSKPKLGDILEKLRETRRLPEQADFRSYKQNILGWFTSLLKPHEDMMYLPSGSTYRMLVIPHPLGGMMMTFEDVTSRLELESSLKTMTAVQEETLDNLAEGVAVYGGDGRLRLHNPAFARLWKLHPEDIADSPHITQLVEKFRRFFTDLEWRDARDLFLAQVLNRSDKTGYIEREDEVVIAYAALPLPDGGIMVTHRDVTDTVRVENALRERTQALEEAEKLKLDFLANVSYQLRTPLNTIIGFNEILDNEFFGALNEKQKEYTKGTHEAGHRLLHLINDILDLSTIEAGMLTLEKSLVDPEILLKSLAGLTQEWARSKQVELHLDVVADLPAFMADERRLKQTIVNLIQNAINYTPEHGNITLGAHKESETLIISVQDTGKGIPEEDLSRIFSPFQKGSNASDKARGGAGLGLTLVKNIIELHNGSVSVESTLGTGTKVTLVLPLE